MNSPSDLLQQLLQSGALQQSAFTPQSRYYGLPVIGATGAGGEVVNYVSRRFIPPTSAYATLQRHRVVQGERVDVVASQTLGDPLYYWRLCDANQALTAEDLTASPGTYINVTLPAGLPGG